jgi:hypothetical protein
LSPERRGQNHPRINGQQKLVVRLVEHLAARCGSGLGEGRRVWATGAERREVGVSKQGDPVLKLMRMMGLITNEEYFKASAQTGKNWIELAGAVLNLRRDLDWSQYLKTALKLPDWVSRGLENRTRFETDYPSLAIPISFTTDRRGGKDLRSSDRQPTRCLSHERDTHAKVIQ